MHTKINTLTNWVIAITALAIFIGFIIPEVNHQTGSKLDFQKSSLKAIKNAIDQFYADYGRYPKSINALTFNNGKYLYEIPVDPVTGNSDWEVREKEPNNKWYINENVKYNYWGSPPNKWTPNALSSIVDIRPRPLEH